MPAVIRRGPRLSVFRTAENDETHRGAKLAGMRAVAAAGGLSHNVSSLGWDAWQQEWQPAPSATGVQPWLAQAGVWRPWPLTSEAIQPQSGVCRQELVSTPSTLLRTRVEQEQAALVDRILPALVDTKVTACDRSSVQEEAVSGNTDGQAQGASAAVGQRPLSDESTRASTDSDEEPRSSGPAAPGCGHTARAPAEPAGSSLMGAVVRRWLRVNDQAVFPLRVSDGHNSSLVLLAALNLEVPKHSALGNLRADSDEAQDVDWRS